MREMVNKFNQQVMSEGKTEVVHESDPDGTLFLINPDVSPCTTTPPCPFLRSLHSEHTRVAKGLCQFPPSIDADLEEVISKSTNSPAMLVGPAGGGLQVCSSRSGHQTGTSYAFYMLPTILINVP